MTDKLIEQMKADYQRHITALHLNGDSTPVGRAFQAGLAAGWKADAEVIEAAKELAARVEEWSNENLSDENCRDWFGHVEPALAAFNAALAKEKSDG